MKTTDLSDVQGLTKPRLNLGCGADTWGDVRVDIDFHTQTGMKSKLNIRADAQFLPFVDKAFGHVRCWHVLEHVLFPMAAIAEIRRVGDTANIRFPIDDGYKREFLRNLMTPSLRGIRYAVMTRKRRFHLWTIRPKGVDAKINSFELFPFLLKGRKAKLFKRFPQPRIGWEWEIRL